MDERTDEIMLELTEEEMAIIAGGECAGDEDDRVDGAKRIPIRFLPEGMTPDTIREMSALNYKLYKEGKNAGTRGREMYKYANEHGAKMDERSAYWFAKVRGIPGH